MTSLRDVSVGAVWRRADFHLHTPGVRQFSVDESLLLSDGGRPKLIDQYISALATAGIELGAVTDYQGVRKEWFEPLCEGAKERGIVLLPGAELDLEVGKGLHLLIVFDPKTSPDSINKAIAHIDKGGGDLFTDRSLEHRSIRLRGSLEAALRELRNQLPCVVIAAHANEAKGLFKAIKVGEAGELIREGLIDAIDKCDDAKMLLQSTSPKNTHIESLACIVGSDPKALADIGTKKLDGKVRATWIKLSGIDVGGLRLAMHDPDVRVLRRPPAPIRHDRIVSMEVSGGFLNDIRIRFSDDLTTLIGGRGAGKSAILETLRYALDIDPYSDHTERLSLVERALGSGGQVRVVAERPGSSGSQQIEIKRIRGQRPRIVDLGTGETLAIAPSDVFGQGRIPTILLQREIAAVSRSDEFRRRLLDDLVGDDARRADSEVRRLLVELEDNTRAISAVADAVSKAEAAGQRLATIESEIAYFNQQGVANKLSKHSALAADGARVEAASADIGGALEMQAEFADEVRDAVTTAWSTLGAAQSEQSGPLRELAEHTSRARVVIDSALAAIGSELGALSTAIVAVEKGWPDKIAAVASELRRIELEMGVDRIDSQHYLDAVAERTSLRPIAESSRRAMKRLAELEEQREKLRRDLQDVRRAAFETRARAARKVNKTLSGKLKLDVTYLGDVSRFGEELAALLRGSGIGKDAIEQMTSTDSVDGLELTQAIALGSGELARRFGLTPATSDRLVKWAADHPDRVSRLEGLAPSDQVSMALIVDHRPRDLSELSGGQRATALLLLLFAQGDRVLVLDQPEDDLDNRFVFNDVVELLRDEKGTRDPSRRRQIIVATHNANIPVNGDAELVVSLADNSGNSEVVRRGSIDDAPIRDEIRAVLEGGEEAFRRRAEKYGTLE